jgi:myo-inositol-1(or 4)-monophosphatase
MECQQMSSDNHPATDVAADHVALLDLAERMARAAGELIRDGLANERTLDTKSSATDLVTEMDKAAEALLVAMIDAERAEDGIIGEEGASRPGTSGFTWVLDPIDGTTNYVYRHPFFSVSVGLECNGVGVVGAVYIPMLDEMFAASLGNGATLNGKPIHTSGLADISKALVGTGFAYSAKHRAIQGARVASLLPQIREIRRGGSAAIDLCFVACGRLDGYYEDGLNHWDESAGLVIASEAGAQSQRLNFSDPESRQVLVVTTPGVMQPLSQLLGGTTLPTIPT